MGVLWAVVPITLLAILTILTVLVSLRPVVFRLETNGGKDTELMSIVDDLWHPWVLHVRADQMVFFNFWRLPFWWLLYRPPENSVGVLYLFERLWYMPGPNECVLVLPHLHEIKRPNSLKKRLADIFMAKRLSEDGVPMDVKCKVYFQVDLRWANADFRLQALEYNEEIWRQIIRTSLVSVANETIAQLTMRELLASDGKKRLKRGLSVMLAKRVRTLGMISSPRYGVMIESILPAERIWEAMVEQMAAPSLGEASRELVEPMLKIAGQHPNVGWEMLTLGWAASMARGDPPPQVLMFSRDGLESKDAGFLGRGPSRSPSSSDPLVDVGGFTATSRDTVLSDS